MFSRFMKVFLLIALAAFTVFIILSERRKMETQTDFAVVGYMPSHRLDSYVADNAALVTDIICFSLSPMPDGSLDSSLIKKRHLDKLAKIKLLYKPRILIAVGGWGRCDNFPLMALNPESRANFVRNLHAYCLENGFDGADLDWEFPADDKENRAYVALIQEIRAAFERSGLMITAALAPEQDLGQAGYDALDRVHLMSYDRGSRHATFESAKQHVLLFLKRGVPREKLCLGVPFYGRLMENTAKAMSYADIFRQFSPSPNLDEAGGYYYNGPDTIAKKTAFARKSGLGGIMIWELGHDLTGPESLLNEIQRAISQSGQ